MIISRLESSERFLQIAYRFAFAFGAMGLLAGLSGGAPKSELVVGLVLLLGGLSYLSTRVILLRMVGMAALLIAPALLFVTRTPMFVLIFLLAGGVLGGAFVGQFLGHWYLNVPNVHIREFKRVSLLALIFILLRASALLLWMFFNTHSAAVGFFKNDSEFFSLAGNAWLGLGVFGVILFAARVLWGLVAPAILTQMARATIVLRSTQSATGIFYANSVLVVLGELTALYLERDLTWPI